MSRPNKKRSIGAETRLAERIVIERAARGWSIDTLANAMSECGCSIQPSAIYKIEKGEPRRRITVDELVALSDVWAIPVERLVR
jgi:transcriptional regulator with XRE-family HTH domain